jgi:hypothetical protein
VGGTARTTTFVSATSLLFQLTVVDQATASNLSVTVVNPAPGGGSSTATTLAVDNPVPGSITLSPSSVPVGTTTATTVTVTGTNFLPVSSVQIGGAARSTTYVSATQLTFQLTVADQAVVGSLSVKVVNPAPGGGTSPTEQLLIVGSDNRLRTLNYPTLDIVSDPIRNLLYASVSSSSATSPNSIVAIDPLQGTVVATQAMSAQPGQLAVTDDGSYLYVSLPSTGQVSRLLLPLLTPDIQWSLGTDGNGRIYAAEDLEAAPGKPHTVAATRFLVGFGNNASGGLAVYDDGVARSLIPSGTYLNVYDRAAWGSDSTTIFASNTTMSGGNVYVFSINQNGPTLSNTLTGALSGFAKGLTFDKTTGRLYDASGDAIDATTGSSAGQINVVGGGSGFAIDSNNGKAFFIGTDSSPFGSTNYFGSDIQAFDCNTYSYVNAIDIPSFSGSKLVRWGASGLAVGGGSQIYIIDGSFVSPTGVTSPVGSYLAESPTLTSISPQTVQAGSGDTVVTLTGQNFSQAAVVVWNGQTIPFTWQSSTQGTATISASLMTQPVSSPMYISNGPGTENSIGASFTVLPDLGPNTLIAAMNVSGEDMVWDPARSLLYVAVTNPAVSNGNSIAVVDPAAAALRNVVYTGNQPASLGISNDGTYLYSGFQTLASVKRFALPGFSLNLTIPLNSGIAGESYAGDVKVAPGQNQTIAVSMGNKNTTPRDAGGLAIFDNATERPKALAYSYGDVFKFTWGKDATRLYGQSDPEGTPQTSSMLTIDSTGITGRSGDGGALGYILLRPHYDAGANLVYSDGGQIINPANGTQAGVFGSYGLMVPDSTLNRAFFLQQDTTNGAGVYDLKIFNLSTQTLLKTIPLASIVGYPTQLVRWGSQGVAFLTDSYGTGQGLLYILQGSDISGLSSPPPWAITLNPARVVEGSASGTTITVTGTNFLSTSTVLVNGSARTTTFVNSTQLSFHLTFADQASANYLSVAVTNSGGGTTSPAASLEVDNPVPVITSLSNAFVPVGSVGTKITISGSGFIPATVIQFNGSARTTTYVSSTQVTAATTYVDVATVGNIAITAVNPGPGGGTSTAVTVEVDSVPSITGLSPSTLPAGSPASSIAVTGTNFVPSTVVQLNGSARPTTYSSPTYISVALTAADLASAGTLTLTAVNPAPNGGTSNAVSFAVSSTNPTPQISSLSQYYVTAGASAPTTVTVIGTGFVPLSTVQVGGAPRLTTYINVTEVTFQLTVADQATVGNLSITVVNPAPGGGTSSALNITIYSGALPPVVYQLVRTQYYVGEGNATVIVNGAHFTSSCVVNWNGAPLTVTGQSSAWLYASVPQSLVSAVGTATVTVSNPASGPSVSNAITVVISLPTVPVLTSLSASAGPSNTATSLAIYGGPFVQSSTVSWNGFIVPSTYVSVEEIDLTLPASSVAAPGNYSVIVNTPAPGGGTSTPLMYTAYIGIANNSMVYNPVNGLLYVSVPGSAGAPYGNSIVSIDPATGVLGTPIYVGSEPDKLAITSDGKYLWVGLDGAAAVRQVDLTANTAGLQFQIKAFSAPYSTIEALALAALPGSDNSVIVAASNTNPAIYDGGVLRGAISSASLGSVSVLLVNGTLGEIYAINLGSYSVYTYNASGLTLKSSITSLPPGPYSSVEMQLLSGTLYTDFGQAFNSETGALLGTFYNSAYYNGAYPASGPSYADAALGKIFYLDTGSNTSYLYQQIQAFNLSDYSPSNTQIIPITVVSTTGGSLNADPSSLTRWGSNGLAFRTASAIYSVRSIAVNDLSSVNADLSVTVSASGASSTGSDTTYTATVINAGPSASTNIVFNGAVPSTGVLVSATSSTGSCSTPGYVECNLGSLASGAEATVTVVVQQLSSGTATFTATVSGSENDPNPANNQASATATITGSTYNLAPVVTSISPSTVLSGSSATTITVNGMGFSNASSIVVGGASLPTTFVSSTQLTAVVTAGQLTTLGWEPVSVSNPSPGGGTSTPLSLTIFSVLSTGANHILYDPYTRKIMASIAPQTTPIAGNSIVAITPETATIGTPVLIGSQPAKLALTPDGQILYTILAGSNSVARFNMLTQQPDFTVALAATYNGQTSAPNDLAVQPGTENTIALNLGEYTGTAIFDFNPAAKTAAIRGQASTTVNGSCLQFVDANDLLEAFDLDNEYNSSLLQYVVPTGGFVSGNAYTNTSLDGFACVVVSNGIAYGTGGGVANPGTIPATSLGTFPPDVSGADFSYNWLDDGVPDTSLKRSFFLVDINAPCSPCYVPGGIAAYNQSNFLPTDVASLTMATIEGAYSFSAVDLIRWGQDGLAVLTSSGHIYLLRGPVVVPQELNSNSPANLTSSSVSTITHGTGNTLLTLTGSNFVPGVAVTWNGSYRTTTILSPTQLSVAIPASDLASIGSGSLVATNPGASGSSPITLTIN